MAVVSAVALSVLESDSYARCYLQWLPAVVDVSETFRLPLPGCEYQSRAAFEFPVAEQINERGRYVDRPATCPAFGRADLTVFIGL